MSCQQDELFQHIRDICGRSKCDVCSHGQFQTMSGQNTCELCSTCGEGKVRVDCRADFAGICESCPAGQFKNNISNMWNKPCSDCPTGTSSGIGAGACMTCVEGQFQDVARQATCKSCLPCPAGQVRTGCNASSPGTCEQYVEVIRTTADTKRYSPNSFPTIQKIIQVFQLC